VSHTDDAYGLVVRGGGGLGRWGIMPGDDVALAPLVLVGENLISSD
jgi:hypothetical protein